MTSHPLRTPRPAPARPWSVWCVKRDGSEREFQRYVTRDEALVIAARLAEVGCTARVIGPDDQPEAA